MSLFLTNFKCVSCRSGLSKRRNFFPKYFLYLLISYTFFHALLKELISYTFQKNNFPPKENLSYNYHNFPKKKFRIPMQKIKVLYFSCVLNTVLIFFISAKLNKVIRVLTENISQSLFCQAVSFFHILQHFFLYRISCCFSSSVRFLYCLQLYGCFLFFSSSKTS